MLQTLHTLINDLHSSRGLGTTKNSAIVIDPTHEDSFWEISLLGFSTAKVLMACEPIVMGPSRTVLVLHTEQN